MATFETQLVRRELVAEGTMAFYFEKPSTFRHQAGQSLTMTLINPPETDEEGDTRTFTVASAPHEPHLMIATRMRDTAFKRVIGSTRLGMVVRIDGPDGVMVLHNDAARPADAPYQHLTAVSPEGFRGNRPPLQSRCTPYLYPV